MSQSSQHPPLKDTSAVSAASHLYQNTAVVKQCKAQNWQQPQNQRCWAARMVTFKRVQGDPPPGEDSCVMECKLHTLKRRSEVQKVSPKPE